MISHKDIKLSVVEVMGWQEKYLPCGHISINFVPTDEAEFREACEFKLWRLNNLYQIVDEGGREVLFRLRYAQLQFLLDRHGLDVILKSRQHGFTTLIDLDILDDVIWIPNLRCGIIAHTKLDAQAIFHDKIQFPYERMKKLPFIGGMIPKHTKNDAGELRLENNSSVRVGTSFRSASIHRNHVSELAKICAKYPSRATEIISGTFPAIHPQEGGCNTVESTAEGAAGIFYDMCQEARAITTRGNLNVKEMKFHFFAWHEDPKNYIDPTFIQIPEDLVRYFDDLEKLHGVRCSAGQKAWYATTKHGPGGLKKLMKQEHPSVIDEAFESSVEGAVYAEEMLTAHEEGRICRVPYEQGAPVYTFWDLGISKGNACSVIYAQFIKGFIHIIDYYEMESRGMPYHAKQVLGKQYNYPRGTFCYGPHDITKRDTGSGTVIKDTAEACGLRFRKTKKPQNKEKDGIEAVRLIFNKIKIDNRCLVNEKGHFEGGDRLIKALSYYRYDWDEDLKMWSKSPIHDWSSNGADSLQTLALAHKYNTFSGEYLGDVALIGRMNTNHGTDYQRSEDYNWHGR